MTRKLGPRAFLLAFLTLLLTSVPARADALLTFNFFALNLSDEAQLFSFTFDTPYSGGPFGALNSQFSFTVSDGSGDGAVSVAATDASGFMMVPHLDGTAVGAASLGTGCNIYSSSFFTDLACSPPATVSVAVSTLSDGVLAATVSFSLSGGDSITGEGRLELTSMDVPEPVSGLLLGLGVGAAAIRRRRPRRSA